MFMTLLRDRSALDGSRDRDDPARHTEIPEGRHEIERVQNPYGYRGNWLVLKGTLIGATEESWREWVKRPDRPLQCKLGDQEVIIEE